MTQYKGNRYVPKLMGEWDNTIKYESLMIVEHQGSSYTSKQIVPIGVDILNEVFWVCTGNYNAQIELYRANVNQYKLLVENAIDTINSSLSDIAINVKGFGAIGDGVTDDTQAIQNAINYACDNHLKVVNDIDKTYICNEITIVNKNNFSIDFRGVLKRAKNSVTDVRKVMLDMTSCSNFIIDNISFDGNGINNGCRENLTTYPPQLEGSHCLYLKTCTDFRINYIHGVNPMGDILVMANECKNSIINDVIGIADEAIGRNCVSLLGVDNIFIKNIDSINIGHNKMPGGLCIEPWAINSVAKNIRVLNCNVETKGFEGLSLVAKQQQSGELFLNPLVDGVYIGKCKIVNSNINKSMSCTIINAHNIEIDYLEINAPTNHSNSYLITNQQINDVYNMSTNININRLISKQSYYGLYLYNMKDVFINADLRNCCNDIITMKLLENAEINIIGKYSSNAITTSNKVVFNGYDVNKNITISGDLSRDDLVGTCCVISNAIDDLKLENIVIKDLDVRGYSGANRALSVDNGTIKIINCKGLSTEEGGLVYSGDDTSFVPRKNFRNIGDVIINTKPSVVTINSIDYIVFGWVVKNKTGVGYSTTYEYVQNKVQV